MFGILFYILDFEWSDECIICYTQPMSIFFFFMSEVIFYGGKLLETFCFAWKNNKS